MAEIKSIKSINGYTLNDERARSDIVTGLAAKADKTHTHNELHTHDNQVALDKITDEKMATWDNHVDETVGKLGGLSFAVGENGILTITKED